MALTRWTPAWNSAESASETLTLSSERSFGAWFNSTALSASWLMPLAGMTRSMAVVFSIIQQKDKFWLIDVPGQQVCFEIFVSKTRQKCTGQLKRLCRGNFQGLSAYQSEIELPPNQMI